MDSSRGRAERPAFSFPFVICVTPGPFPRRETPRMPLNLFDAFTGLAAILTCAIVAGVFLCARDIEADDHRDWTLRPRR